MTLVLNRDWGGYSMPQDICDAYDLGDVWDTDIERNDLRLVKWVREHLDEHGKYGDLALVEIPDNCTDYEIDEYDGWESIIYVVDGKIYHA